MTGIRLANCWRRCTNLFFKDFHFVAEVVRSVSWKSHDPKVIVCLWHQGSLVIIVLVNSAAPWGFGGENEVRRFGGKFPVANQNHSPIPIPIDYLETWKILVSLKYWRVTFLSATWHFRLLVDNVCLCICSVVSFEGSKFKVFFICSIHSLIFAPESQAAASGGVWGLESPKRRKRLIMKFSQWKSQVPSWKGQKNQQKIPSQRCRSWYFLLFFAWFENFSIFLDLCQSCILDDMSHQSHRQVNKKSGDLFNSHGEWPLLWEWMKFRWDLARGKWLSMEWRHDGDGMLTPKCLPTFCIYIPT